MVAARWTWAHAPQLAAGLAAAIPVISSAIAAVRDGWVPAGDDGIIATRGWDVLTSHTPLVGQYSEAGLVIHGQIAHSPGPMLYWLLALPARYGSVASIAVVMGALNTLAIVACVVLARRRGGLVLMFATATGIALMCQSLPAEAMHDIWNPAAGLFGFLTLIFVCWSLACGEYRLLPLAALLASYVTQTHLMYAVPTAVLLAVGCGGLAAGSLARRRAGPRIWPWALAALAVTAVCWTEPAIDQIEGARGNLAVIVHTAERRGPQLGLGVGWHAVVRSIGVRPWWLYVPASEWERKADVRRTPSPMQSDSAIALLAALALAGLVGACVARWDLAAAALIGLGLCAAIGLSAAANPATRLLAETLGYTLWWGSELGLWVWLVLAWALWLGLAAISRTALRALRRRRERGQRQGRRQGQGRGQGDEGHTLERPTWVGRMRPAMIGVGSIASLGAVVAVGGAVARTAKPDSHVYEYRPIRASAAGIERAIPPDQTVEYRFGPLDLGTQPMEPAIRFMLVRHGDRVLARGSYPRLGSYYELYNRPVQWIVYLRDGTRPPRPHMRLAARVRFTGPWGRETLSAWVSRARRPPVRRARAS